MGMASSVKKENTFFWAAPKTKEAAYERDVF